MEITSKKVRGNNADFSNIEITLKKVRGNNVDFLTIKITSKKVHGNDVEIRRDLVFDVSMYIHVDSTWSACWVFLVVRFFVWVGSK